MDEQRQSSLRVIAPASLAVFAVLVVIVLAVSLGGSSDGGSSATSTQQTQPKQTKRHFYTVKLGDSLQLISEKTGVPVSQLQALNPDLDPQALQTGQRIKLR